MPDESSDSNPEDSPTVGRVLGIYCVAVLVLLAPFSGCLGSPPTGSGPGPEAETTAAIDFGELQEVSGSYEEGDCSANVSNHNITVYGDNGVQVVGTFNLTGSSAAFSVDVTVLLRDENGDRVSGNTRTIDGPINPGNPRNFSIQFPDQQPSQFDQYVITLAC